MRQARADPGGGGWIDAGNAGQLIRAMADGPTPMALTDLSGRWSDVNTALCELIGRSGQELLELSFQGVTHPDDLDRDLEQMQQLADGERTNFEMRKRFLHASGRAIWIDLWVSAIYDESRSPVAYLSQMRDVTSKVEHETAQAEALTDDLTGLPNRRWLMRRLDEITSASPPSRRALALIDLDGFKELNDTLGHQAGDIVLELVAERLRRALPADASIARLGGDEFAVLMPYDAADHVCASLHGALAPGLAVGDLTIGVHASIGVALHPDHGSTAASLLRCADVAMYGAKRRRAGLVVYEASSDLHTIDHFRLASDLRRTIEAGALSLAYQPKVHVATGALAGVEALVRWPHPERGTLLPAEFVPIAEKGGLMRPLTRWVLRSAIGQAAVWRRQGTPVPVAVNISVTDLIDSDFPELVRAALEEHGLPPRQLELEITENDLIADPSRAFEVIDALAALGVRLALDDFGTGYSSLEHLRHLAIDALKIDRSFVTGMARSTSDAAIVRCAIDLGKALGLTVVAEGVEDAATADLLAAYGCDAAQGYFYARPLPPDAIEAWAHEPVADAA